ncbi:fibronectin type III domain-containing protein [Paracrocinitomix mangrovi]|uniref:fibronectin type III domain-containing protein n=1 Tax=Paracrocinitomix mangrovi TaxID=2862509 RepID=UPI001C8E8790|nr:fibronectin type III domain-containing protein [Paracrocinitomix mangrovi]UKN00230.1 fibronectin type III domain-containing protein [Paracrocinitomix mangrovi]
MKKILLAVIPVLLLLASCNNQPPSDVTLHTITQDVDGIQISWDQSSDGNFSSYKLYKHNSSGLDETTGELIHVATSATDISFTDVDFNPLQTYYYRVYVENDNGLSNGSNIQSITTETITIVSNGSFEEGNTIPTSWTLIKNNINEPLNEIELDNTTAADGSRSLKFHQEASPGCYEQWIYQSVSLSDLTPGGTYEFSFSYYSGNIAVNHYGPDMGFRIYNGQFDIQIDLPDFPGDGQWHDFANNFILPSNLGSTDPTIMIHFCIEGSTDWWIDNINVVKVQ